MRVLLGALLLFAACTRGGGGAQGETFVPGPRVPDVEGIVQDVAPDRIALDGDRVFRIDPEVKSFTTRGHDVTALVRWKGKYVHVGLDEDREAEWVAGIGVVQQRTPAVVLYTGVVDKVDGRRVDFRDGTVLTLAEGVAAPKRGDEVLVSIDPAVRLATKVEPQQR